MNADKSKSVATIANGIRCGIRAAIDKPITKQGNKILINLIPMLTVSGRKWPDNSIEAVAGEFIARLRKIGAPSGYMTAGLIKTLYPNIVEVWKPLDPDWQPISKLLE